MSCVVFNDFDNDGWPDIYVANDSQPNLLFHNKKNGTFEEVGLLSGTALNESGRAQSGMGVTTGDYDGNGFLDILVTNFAGDTNTLYQNLGNMHFVDVTTAAGLGEISLPYLGWGTSLADLNNDGLRISSSPMDTFIRSGCAQRRSAISAAEGDLSQSWRREIPRDRPRDCEILLVDGDTVYCRVNDSLYRASIRNGLAEPTKILTDESIPLADWAFVGR